VHHDGLRFKVEEVDGQRIERLEVEFMERELEDAAEVAEL
jgi:CBS domain containing-hemolysin-like protein